MSQQTARQVARRKALDAHTRVRIRRAEQDKRRAALSVRVVQALAERDAVVAGCERRAGEALRALTQDEGLTLPQAVTWCGDELSKREATRLRRLASPAVAGGSKAVDSVAIGRPVAEPVATAGTRGGVDASSPVSDSGAT